VSVPKFSDLLLDWYQENARSLPWRQNPDPYAVWISEIMLQQTRVETVLPYYARWMETFPTIEELGRASQQEVLAAWEGLGYYGRARNLLRTAQIILADRGGDFPHDPKELRRLPGIGRYTAGAIASIAFHLDAPALDANIRRVYARLFDVDIPARSLAGENLIWQLARDNLPAGNAGDYNQALMDLGAAICTPRQPNCPGCPLKSVCLAYARGVQNDRPVRPARSSLPHHIVTAAVIMRPPLVLIAQRLENGLLGGLWEFPGGKLLPGEDLESCLKREINEELASEIEVGANLGIYRHAYTHFRITLHAFCCRLSNGAQPRSIQVQDTRWVEPHELDAFPMGKIDRQIARNLQTKGSIC
jgi:A/G-specific adenine glycosylase